MGGTLGAVVGECQLAELHHRKCPRNGPVASSENVLEGATLHPGRPGSRGGVWWGFPWRSAKRSPSGWHVGTPRRRKPRRVECSMSSARSPGGPDATREGLCD